MFIFSVFALTFLCNVLILLLTCLFVDFVILRTSAIVSFPSFQNISVLFKTVLVLSVYMSD